MKRVHYAGDSFLTGDAIADAVVQYAGALAKKASSAAVTIPVILDGGRIGSVSMLVGPASQIIASPEASDGPDLEDPELVSELGRAVAMLGDARPQTEPSPARSSEFDDLTF